MVNQNNPSFQSRFRRAFALAVVFGYPSLTIASPDFLTLQSRIMKPDGTPLESATTSFRVTITDPVGTCVVYQEDFPSVNLAGTKGLATLNVGAGAKAYPAGPLTMPQVFDNAVSANFACQGAGNYDPGLTDKRKLVLQFNDGQGWQTLPAMTVNSVPFALHAASAHALSGHPVTDFVQISSIPTCGGGQALHFNGASFTCVAASGGGGGVSSVTSATTDISIATTTTTPVLTLNSGVGANQIVKLNASSELPAVSGVNVTGLNAANLATGTLPSARMPALTGDIEMTAGTTATSIAAGVIVDADINAAAAISRSKIASEGGNGPGNVLVNDGSGNIASLQCGTNEVIKFNGAGVAGCGTDNAGTGDITNGGNTGAVVIGTNDANSLTLETDGIPRMTILSDGSVGVGTVSPTTKLEVGGQITAAAGIVTAPSFVFANSPTSGIFSPAAREVGIVTFGTERMRFDAVGNIGIGTTSPTAGLQISKSATSSTPGMKLDGAWFTGGSGTTTKPTLLIEPAGTTSTNWNVNGTALGVNAPAGFGSAGNLFDLQNDGISLFNVSGGGSVRATSLLNVIANSNPRVSFGPPDVIQNNGDILGSVNFIGVDSNWNTYTGGSIQSTITNNLAGSTSTTLSISTAVNGTVADRLSIVSGNVGIGTTNPQRQLHVSGPMRITPSTVPLTSVAAGDMYVDSADGNKLKIYDGSAWVAAGGGGGGGGVSEVSSANTDIGVATGTTTPVLTLNVGTGNDQIVKLNSSAQLPAVSGVNLTALNASNIASGTIPAARLPALLNAQISDAAAIGRTKLASGSNDHVLINDGSGVMSSEPQLSVSRGGTGLSSFSNNALLMANGTGSGVTSATCSTGEILLWSGTTWACTNLAGSSQGYFKDGGNTLIGLNPATIGTNSNHNLEIETNGSVRMTIDTSGNVGIGTTSSGNRLEVAGNIRQTSGQNTSAPYNNAALVAFDLNNGNLQYTSADCQAMTLTNMQDGGTYTIAVKGTNSGTCSFSHAGLNFWYSPAQGPTSNGSQSTYTFVRMGTDVYVSWISLYQ